MSRFLDALRSGRVLLMDGAMGTELQRAGIQPGECYELWNLTDPDRVRAIHQAYVDAGAEVLLTNTFQANPHALARHRRMALQFEEIVESGVALAQSVAGRARFVLADIGPSESSGFLTIFPEVRPFLAADGILIETVSDISLLLSLHKNATKAIEQMPEEKQFLGMVSLTFERAEDGSLRTHQRYSPEACARMAQKNGATALGVNCGRDIGMDEIIEIIRRYRRVTDLPLFARPNAGTPTRDGERWVYPLTPEMMAARLPELLEAGVSMVGGCCGTTPEHIAAFRPIIDRWNSHR